MYSCNRMFVNAVANSVISLLYLRHNFYNVIFNIKHKLRIVAVSAPQSLQLKIPGAQQHVTTLNIS
jgi:hypothetical protein